MVARVSDKERHLIERLVACVATQAGWEFDKDVPDEIYPMMDTRSSRLEAACYMDRVLDAALKEMPWLKESRSRLLQRAIAWKLSP